MKNKHRIKQCLLLLLAGGIALTNLGAALPAFAEDAPATPENAEAVTPETAEADTTAPNLVQITENLYNDLPDAPTGSYLGSMGLPVATGETKIGISAWVSDLYDGVDAHMDADALNADENTVTIGKTPGTDYAIVPLLAQVEYPADGAVSEIILPDGVELLSYRSTDYEPIPADEQEQAEILHQTYSEQSAAATGLYVKASADFTAQLVYIHSHIVWNSVSCVDGKKYRSNYKSYVTEIRAVSDELCRKYKLSVIDTENSNHVAKPYAEWLAEKNGQPTWRTAIRHDVDEAIQQSLTWRQFLNVLERNGYEVRMGRKYPVLRPPGKERFVRFKTLGKRYTPEAIQTRILYPRSYRPYVENPPTIQHGRLRSGKKPCRKLTGLRALYYRYLYELGALPRKPRRPSYAVRQDAYKLDQRIRQMEFLSKHNIDTLAQLETYRQALQTEIGQLQTKRKQLPKTDDVQSQRESVNTALKQLRQEERLCRKIAEHSIEVQQHLTEARRDRAEQQREQECTRDRRPDITTR